ncbi:MAG: hypothetical protein JST73_07630, partial [Actinobacteria bacterium]|nr:hypothetical protein [Actinomycetota bacterium]
RDKRIKAAAILAGDMAPYPGGTYDLVAAPPLLVVHGTDDSLIPYREGVAIFDAARGPRAMLTIKGGDHMAAAGGIGAAWNPLVARATTDFFLAYLDGDTAARARLAHDGDAQATMTDAPARGSTVTIPLPPKPTRSLHATAEPTDALANGQTITVTWSGYTAGKVVNILQCSGDDANLTNQSGCDFTNAKLLHADPTGTGSVQMQVVTGKVGTGACGAAHPGCFIVVNDASSPDPADMVKIPITFAE